MKHHLGVCSWSLQTERLEELVGLVQEVGVESVQLSLNPLVLGAWDPSDVARVFSEAKIELRSGMLATIDEDYSSPGAIRRTGGIRPNEHWQGNLDLARRCALAAKQLGIGLVSFHAGFLPHERGDPERVTLVERLAQMTDIFAEQGVRVALETGQETAATLLEVLREVDRETLGVNFDPANMILYSMGDPVDALKILGSRVFQVHIKDATGSGDPEVWGAEVPSGTGEVDWRAFFEVLDASPGNVDLMIEREAGDQRVTDMRSARELLEGLDVVEVSR